MRCGDDWIVRKAAAEKLPGRRAGVEIRTPAGRAICHLLKRISEISSACFGEGWSGVRAQRDSFAAPCGIKLKLELRTLDR
jgi:hypothetical protein